MTNLYYIVFNRLKNRVFFILFFNKKNRYAFLLKTRFWNVKLNYKTLLSRIFKFLKNHKKLENLIKSEAAAEELNASILLREFFT